MRSNELACIRAVEDYEEAHGGNCKFLSISRLSEPIQAIDPHILVHTLQLCSTNCGYQDYKVKITYEDDTYRIVKQLEILEKVTP